MTPSRGGLCGKEPPATAALDTLDGREAVQPRVDGAVTLQRQVGHMSLGALQQQLGKVSLRPVTPPRCLDADDDDAVAPGMAPPSLETTGAALLDHLPPLRSKSLEESKHSTVITKQPHHRSRSLEQPLKKRVNLEPPKPPSTRVATNNEQQMKMRGEPSQQQQRQKGRQQRGRSLSLTSLTFVKMRKLFTFRRRTRSLRVRPTVRNVPDLHRASCGS